MQVRILESGNDQLAFQIDDRRVGSSQRSHFLVAADGDNPVAADCQSPCQRFPVIGGPDLAVYENAIGVLFRRLRISATERRNRNRQETSESLCHASPPRRKGMGVVPAT